MGIFNRLPRTSLSQAVRSAAASSKPLALALEPRLMFDGAAVTTAAEAVVAAPEVVDAPATAADTGVDTLADALAGHTPPADRTEIVFVEGDVRDYQTLLDGLPPNTEVHVLDSSRDGLAQMAAILDGRTGIDAIHVISHGAEGQLQLGTLTVTADNVQDHAADLATIGAALTADADILLYGCDVAAGSGGAALIDSLAQTTQADIAASTDATGNAAMGGNWALEYTSGTIETAALSSDAYQGVLVNATFGFETALTGTYTNTVSETVSGETLQVTSVDDTLGPYTDMLGTPLAGGESLATSTTNGFPETSLTFSLSSGNEFDLTSITLCDYAMNGEDLVFTANTGATVTYALASDLGVYTFNVAAHANAANMQGITSFTITTTGGGVADTVMYLAVDAVVLQNITSPDTTAPTVTSIDLRTPATAVTNADTLVYEVAFSEAVSNLSTGDFAVTGTTATVTSVNTIIGNSYAVTVSGGNLAGVTGNVTLGFSGAQNITDTAGNALTNTTPTGTNNPTYAVDNTTPNAPTTPDMTAGTDSGSSNTDNITSDTTPTFTGTAEANSTVKLYTGGTTLVGTATADGSGNWSITSSALGAGTQTITATATDAAGNTGATSGGLSVTIDNSAAAPAALDLATASDSGSSTTDNITSDATPTITGTGEVGATVTLYDTDGTTSLGTATVDGSGNWSITSSVLGAGSHTLTAKQTDVAGNASVASAGLSITIDTSAPAAPTVSAISTDSGSSNTDEITSDTTLVISGTAEASATVTVYRGGVSIGTTTANGLGNWSFDYTGTTLAQGNYNFTATATDAAGNTSGASVALAVTIDTAASAPTGLDLATASDSGSSTTDNLTSDTTPTITGGGAEAGATVTLYDTDGTTSLGTATADGSGNWSITSSVLGAGSHTLTAKQTDTAGNVSTASTGLTITVDTSAPAAPAVTAISTDSGSSSTDGITSDTTLVISGTAEANATVTVYRGGVSLGTVTSDGTGAWSYNYTGTTLAQGNYTFTATATDAAGNTSAVSAGFVVTVDTSAPSAPSAPDLSAGSDSGSSNTDNITNDTTPTVSGTGEVGATVTLYDTNGTTVLGTGTVDGSGNWSITSSALSTGSHTLTAKQTDAAGNVSAASTGLSITIDTSAAAPSAPNLDAGSDSGASSTDDITSDTTPTVTGSGADAGATVTLYDTDGVTSLGSATADGSGNWSITASVLGAGSHTLTAKQTDAAGNVSAASTSLSITVDTSAAAPSAPNLDAASDTGSSTSDDITKDTTPTVSGTAEAGATVTLYDTNGTTVLGTATADGAGNWSITSSALSEGAHTLTAKQTDVAGNTSVASAGLAITIDTTAPAAGNAVITGLSTDSGSSNTDEITSDTTPTVSGTATAGSTVAILQDGAQVGAATADGGGNWSYTFGALADGSYDITVAESDLAGNTGAESTAYAITIDTAAAAPSAPNLSAASDTGSSSTDDITNDTTPTVTGSGAEAGATVTLYDTDGTTSLGTATADGSGNWSITSSVLAAGSHTLTAKQTDTAGNVSVASAGLTISIDTTAPAAPSAPNLDAASDTGSSSTDDITKDTTPTVSGTAEANATVTLYDTDGTTVLGTTTADGAGNWSITASTLSQGAHTLTAKQTDTAGNTGVASAGLSITIDTTAPAGGSTAVTGMSTDSGSSNSDRITSDTTPSLSGTATAGSTVAILRDGVQVGTATADGSGNWSYTSAALADGSYSFTARETDLAGNTGAASAAFSVTVDTAIAAPTVTAVSSDSGTAGDGLTNDAALTISGTAEANATVSVSVDGNVVGSATANASGAWSFDYTGTTLAEGAHTITATATDPAGNVSAASGAFSVTVDATAPSAASGTLTVAENSAAGAAVGSVSASDTHSVSYSLTDDAGGRFVIDAATGAITVASGASLDFEGGASHDIVVRVTDDAGNTTDTTLTVQITDANEAPTAADATVEINAGRPYTFSAGDFGFSDVDAGNSLQQITVVSLPADGTLALNGHALAAGDTVSAADINAGRLTFESTSGGMDGFGFSVSDGSAVSATYTLSLNVSSPHRPPVFAQPSNTPHAEPPAMPPAPEQGVADNVVRDAAGFDDGNTDVGGTPLWVRAAVNDHQSAQTQNGSLADGQDGGAGNHRGVLERLLDSDVDFDLEDVEGDKRAEAEPFGHRGFAHQVAAVSDRHQHSTERLARALRSHAAAKV